MHSSRFRFLLAWNRMLYRVLVHSPSFPPLVWTCIPHRKLSSPSTSRFADPPADLFLANALSVGSFDHRKLFIPFRQSIRASTDPSTTMTMISSSIYIGSSTKPDELVHSFK